MGKALSKSDNIDPRYLKPSGTLYKELEWDPRVVRKLILDRKLAPFYPGTDQSKPELEECPICFLNYPGGLNRAKCCKQPICTECFLQVKKPTGISLCPFCNSNKYGAIFYGPKSREEIAQEELEQQKVLELQMQMRADEVKRDEERAKERANRPPAPAAPAAPAAAPASPSLNAKRQPRSNPISVAEPEPQSPPGADYVRSAPTESTAGTAARVHVPHRTTRHGHRQSRHAANEEMQAQNMLLWQLSGGRGNPQDLDELMLMQAIQLSLLETGTPTAEAAAEATPLPTDEATTTTTTTEAALPSPRGARSTSVVAASPPTAGEATEAELATTSTVDEAAARASCDLTTLNESASSDAFGAAMRSMFDTPRGKAELVTTPRAGKGELEAGVASPSVAVSKCGMEEPSMAAVSAPGRRSARGSNASEDADLELERAIAMSLEVQMAST